MDGQREIKFETIWQKMDRKEGKKEDMIRICSHKVCQGMTKEQVSVYRGVECVYPINSFLDVRLLPVNWAYFFFE